MIAVSVDVQPIHTFFSPPELSIGFIGNERMNLPIHLAEALKRDSKVIQDALTKGKNLDVTKRDFLGFLNALYPDGWGVELSDIELIELALKLDCSSLLIQILKKLREKVYGFERKDLHQALRLYILLRENKIRLFEQIYAQYLGRALEETESSYERKAMIAAFCGSGVEEIELSHVDQERLDELIRFESLKRLIIQEGKMRQLRNFPNHLQYLKIESALYLDSTIEHRLTPYLETFILESGGWLNDDFVKSLPRSVRNLTLFMSELTESVIDSLPDGIEGLFLSCVAYFTDQGMSKLPRSLLHLKISGSQICGNAGLSITRNGIRNLPQLKSLSLYGKLDIHDHELELLPKSLELLELGGRSSNLTEQCLSHLIHLRQLCIMDAFFIKKPITFLEKLHFLEVHSYVEFSGQKMFPDSLLGLKIYNCSPEPEDLRLLPKSLMSLVINNATITEEHIAAIPPWISYVELNHEILRGEKQETPA